MNNVIVRNTIRGIILLFLQVLVLKRVDLGFGSFNYVEILLYPLFFILLPIKIPTVLALLIAFFYGSFIDMFYDSPGVHASVCIFIAFVRPYVLKILEPDNGYAINASPTKHQFGALWFLRFAGIILLLHILSYFVMDFFSLVYIKDILLKTIFSFAISALLIILHQYIFNPKR